VGNGVTTEAEESRITKMRYRETSSEGTAEEWPLLKAVTKERLVKVD
jgi:hypothetical protein